MGNRLCSFNVFVKRENRRGVLDVQWYWADGSEFVVMSANTRVSLGTGQLGQISYRKGNLEMAVSTVFNFIQHYLVVTSLSCNIS